VIFRTRRPEAPEPAPREVKPPSDFSGFTLESTTGPESGRAFPLALGEFTLGRDDVNRIVIADPNISRVHANLAVGTDAVEITDLNSRNGTYINGERIASARLSVGDELRVGMSVLVLRGR
jgi:S-DNA-T family DNA segregation ATPase FtsK/SpoIIIE